MFLCSVGEELKTIRSKKVIFDLDVFLCSVGEELKTIRSKKVIFDLELGGGQHEPPSIDNVGNT